MATKLSLFSRLAFFLLIVVQALVVAQSELTPFSKTLYSLAGARKGQTLKGLKQVKQYLKAFGYYFDEHINLNTDKYDNSLESAVKRYQSFYRLKPTGRLDGYTIKRMVTPRCGEADLFKKQPPIRKWSKRELNYSFNSSQQALPEEVVSPIVARSFDKWATASEYLTIQPALTSPQTDMVLGFHRREHGDGYSFDGPQGVLAHAFYPEDGRCHYDAEEYWSATEEPPQDPIQVDFEWVALHEMGHLLGLNHSQNRDSIMFPEYPDDGVIRRDLHQEDIDRIKALYNSK